MLLHDKRYHVTQGRKKTLPEGPLSRAMCPPIVFLYRVLARKPRIMVEQLV